MRIIENGQQAPFWMRWRKQQSKQSSSFVVSFYEKKKKLQRHLTPSNPHYKVVAENLHPIKEISTGIDLGNMSDCMHIPICFILVCFFVVVVVIVVVSPGRFCYLIETSADFAYKLSSKSMFILVFVFQVEKSQVERSACIIDFY